MRLAQRLLDPMPAGNCKLQTLRQYDRLPERGAHTALGDVGTVADLFARLCRNASARLAPRKLDFRHWRLEASRSAAIFPGMSTLAEIEEAIETLPVGQVDQLASWLEKRRRRQPAWPVPPPNVERAELERIEAVIEAEFPTLKG